MSRSADAVAEELRETERRRLAALVMADMDAATAMHADDYELITPGGSAISRVDYLGGIAARRLVYRVFEPESEIAVRVYETAAVLRYQARIEADFDGRVDSGRFWHTDIYERRGGVWQAVWSQATRIR